MATFHLFTRLPLELRILIWKFTIEPRVLRVKKRMYSNNGCWSPTPVPAVTRACRESRKYCSYQKAFIRDPIPRYIWTNFDVDVIHIRTHLIAYPDLLKRDEVRNLRIDLEDDRDGYEAEDFFHRHSHQLRYFPKLESFWLIVAHGLMTQWTSFIDDMYWGACPKENVKIVDAKTGGWIDHETSGVYQDYIDTSGGQSDWYTRTVNYSEDEEDKLERKEAMKRLQMPLPQVNLDEP